jgi:hypothetical protein
MKRTSLEVPQGIHYTIRHFTAKPNLNFPNLTKPNVV